MALAGLSFHSHGEAWLGVLNITDPDVSKRWFLYPPGKGFSEKHQQQMNPYLPVQSLAKQHLDVTNFDSLNQEFLYCDQYPGEIMYIPDGWAHMTLNRGSYTKFVATNISFIVFRP